jgi:hypothetical protein
MTYAPESTISPRFNGASGYRLDHDRVDLNTSIEIPNEPFLNTNWQLELWASATPFAAGTLSGECISTFFLNPLIPPSLHINGSTQVFPPAARKLFFIALALVQISENGSRTIADTVYFEKQQKFLQPRMGGVTAEILNTGHLKINITRIENPRDAHDISGALSLEAWAVKEEYDGGNFNGECLGAFPIQPLMGRAALLDSHYLLENLGDFPDLPYRALMLREWNGNGYITRDFLRFNKPKQNQEDSPSPSEKEAPQNTEESASSIENNTTESNKPKKSSLKAMPNPLAFHSRLLEEAGFKRKN